jgi:hypothetical protein
MSVVVIKYVGGILAAISLFAGVSGWAAVYFYFDYWQEFHRPISRWNPVSQSVAMRNTFLISVACAVALHAAHLLILRWFSRRAEVLNFSRRGWRTLLIGSYATGLVGGAIPLVVYFVAGDRG